MDSIGTVHQQNMIRSRPTDVADRYLNDVTNTATECCRLRRICGRGTCLVSEIAPIIVEHILGQTGVCNHNSKYITNSNANTGTSNNTNPNSNPNNANIGTGTNINISMNSSSNNNTNSDQDSQHSPKKLRWLSQ